MKAMLHFTAALVLSEETASLTTLRGQADILRREIPCISESLSGGSAAGLKGPNI
jgi:hypothetical protein